MAELTNVTVLGTGVLGSQIAFQTAYHGHPVVAYDISAEAIDAARERFAGLVATYQSEVADPSGERATAALGRIRLSHDLRDAVAEADLVIEAVPENPDIKRDTYQKLAAVAPEHTVFATNSSTLLPSELMAATGRPDRFLALHFANRVWVMNTAEIMGTAETDPAVFRSVVDFAAGIGMVPIEIKKEQAGYVLNSLLVPLLQAAGDLLVDGVADPETIDKTWRIGTGAPLGPFQIYDVIGLTTPYNISLMGGPKQQAFAKLLKEQYLDRGKLGVASGEGFYRY